MITPACTFFARVARRCRLEILHEEIPFRTPNPDQRPQARAHEAAVAAVQEVLPLSWQEASGEAINAVEPLPKPCLQPELVAPQELTRTLLASTGTQ